MSSIAKVIVAYEVARWEEKALIEAAKELDLEVVPLHLHNTVLQVGSASGSLGLDPEGAIVLQRAISHAIAVNSSLALESLGFRVINSSLALIKATNKLWTLSILSAAGIPVPRTAVTFSSDASIKAAAFLGYPLVLKPIDGSWGRLIALVRDEEELRAVLEHREYIPSPAMKVHMLQEYVKKPGRDLRVFVVGGEVVTAIYRVSDHWITNMARGGKAMPAPITEELRELALRTAEVLGIEVAGIDIFEDPERGYLVNEANAVPEFKNTVAVTGCKVHLKIMEYVKKELRV